MDLERKRPSDGPVSDAKRVSADTQGPVNDVDIENFQKDALFRELASCRRERDELKSQLDAAQNGDEALKIQLNELTEKYLTACKKADRLASPIVDRVMHVHQPSKAKQEESKEDEQVKTSSNQSDAKEIIDLKSKLAAAEGEVAKTKEFIAQEDLKRQELEKQVRLLDEKLASAPKTVEMVEQLKKTAIEETERKSLEAQKLQQELADLKGTLNDFETKLKEKNLINITQLEAKLQTAENDVHRIRSARDELLSEVNVLKAECAEHRNEANRLKELFELEQNNFQQQKPTKVVNPPPADLPTDADKLREKCLSLIKMNQILSEEISGLETGFAKAQEKAKTAFKQTATAEQKLGILNTAKVKSDEKYINAMRARDSLQMELQKCKAALAKSAEVVSDFKVNEQRQNQQISKLQKELAHSEVLLQQKKHQNDMLKRSKAESDGLVSTLRLNSEKLREQLSQRDVEKSAADMARRTAQTEVEKLNRELETQRAISGLSGASDMQEQLESLRFMTKCPVCNKNWKNRVISTCGHTLCNECVQSRLDARMRNCPMCNEHFAQIDVVSIIL